MDGKILANSIVSLNGTDLRMVYALFCKTNLGDLITAKTKDLFIRKQDQFTKHLEEEVVKLQEKSDETLQVDLFVELTKSLKLKNTKYALQAEVEEQSTNIVNGVYSQFHKQDKQFRNYSGEDPRATKLQKMINFQMKKVFNKLDENFGDFSIENQTKFASEVNDYIQGLPEYKQKQIREKLGLNKLTDQTIRTAIATSGSSIVFAVIVEVSGFAFYTTATSLMAAFAGVFGITLPFSAYVGLTSTIAVLANPMFMIPLVLGGGVAMISYQNSQLKKRLLPIIIMQITLPYMSEDKGDASFDLFIKEWNSRYIHYSDLSSELSDLQKKEHALTTILKQQEEKYKSLTEEAIKEEKNNEVELESIRLALKVSDLDSFNISPSFEKYKEEYRKSVSKSAMLNELRNGESSQSNLLSKWGKKVATLNVSKYAKHEEKAQRTLLSGMLEEIFQSTSSYKHEERANILAREKKLEELTAASKLMASEIGQHKEELKKMRVDKTRMKRKLKSYESENYWINDLKAT